MARVQPSLITQKLFPDIIWNLPNNEKKLYLTFDDGPTPHITKWILDVLKEYNAKATFFCLGKNVEKYPDIFNKILEDNHSVGNHSYSHINGWKTKTKEYLQDIDIANNIIKTSLFRPPYGKIKISQYKYLCKKYKIVMWTVLSKDYNYRISNEACFNNVVEYAKEGSVIVFHDSEKAKNNMVYTLPRTIKYFKKLDYEFCSI